MTQSQRILKNFINITSVLGIIGTIVLCIYGYRIGVFQSSDVLEGVLLKSGVFAPLVFVLFQIIQVVIPIIPGGLGLLAGSIIFGPILGFIYNYIGIVIGSIINFILARKYGRPFVKIMLPEKVYNKYIGWLDREESFGKWFTFAILFPIAPDDYLCLVAGMTKMTLKKFVTIILLCKPFTLIAYSFGLVVVSNWIVGLL